MRRWFRMKIRKYIKPPKDLARAAVIRRRLAFCYVFMAWNALGIYFYHRLQEDYPMTKSEQKMPALWYLRLIGENEVNVVTFEGLKKKSHIRFDAVTDTVSPVDRDTILPVYETDETEEVV